ncbi:hypothetical protein M407DRAFT_155362 [Tulasnella calospora MUT 4182]|uniref:Putative zinc-finger domain-containing protein n=1 Tax=Tulasnella calospora MUT 4182 TaxID=1051891 RepID=A0A0C3QPR6_9AGAM|nr:hypothetical protein M407DRAFT_155362 [Tulasnella calospora MUT 4182]
MYAVDEDGDQGIFDAVSPTAKKLQIGSPPQRPSTEANRGEKPPDSTQTSPIATSRAASPTKAAAKAVFGSKDYSLPSISSSSADAFDAAEFAKYQNPIGWYDTANNHPLAPSHTVQHSQGVIDLMPLRAQALTRYDPNKQLCQYEVPGGGTCIDPTCRDCHIRDTLPTGKTEGLV